MVCTSTGGIIALGLGVKNWSVEECRQYFQDLCHEAFTPRKGSQLPLIGYFVENRHESRYETKPWQKALVDAFSLDDCLFGGSRMNFRDSKDTKVAVTATSATGAAVVISNYNRVCEEKCREAKALS